MAQWVNFDELKSQVTIKDVLAHYGLVQGSTERTTKRGVELRIRCPFHEEKTPSLSINMGTGRFHCFGCKAKGGDILDFVVTKEAIAGGDRTQNRRQAALLLQEWFGVESTRPSPNPTETIAEVPAKDAKKSAAVECEASTEHVLVHQADVPVNPPLTFTFKALDHRHAYLLQERGLKEATIDAFGLGYHAGKGIMHNRVVIPIHNEQGELVAYAGRSLGEPPAGEGKYKFPPNFRKSLVLFNLHRAREHASEGLIVVEGFFTVFDLWQRGRKNVVALMGSAMSEEQERLIVETAGPKGRVLLALDADEAGRKGSADALGRLVARVFVREAAL